MESYVQTACRLCPRECGADRRRQPGVCGCAAELRAARAGLHFGEEPCISGARGSGAVFFSGCPLKCCFCQNTPISHGGAGREISPERLVEIFLELQDKGAHNLDLVTATPHLFHLLPALERVKPRLRIPVVYNSSGYEKEETLRMLEGLVDVYLPDLKYYSADLSSRYSSAPDYFPVAIRALKEMYRQTGPAVFDGEGMLARGVLVRHLVLPGCRRDSVEVLRRLAQTLPVPDIRLSLMNQYTPCYGAADFPEIDRRVWSAEYRTAADEALRLGFSGYFQDRASATLSMTPEFDGSGL